MSDIFSFDITSDAPPSEEQLKTMRVAVADLDAERWREEGLIWRFSVAGGIVAGISITWMFMNDRSLVPISVFDWLVTVFGAVVSFVLIFGFVSVVLQAATEFTIGIVRKRSGERELPMANDLIELNYSGCPDECIKFVSFCEVDETVRRYQNRLAEMGRRPVVGEFRAAKRWVMALEGKQCGASAAQEARQACTKLEAAI